MVTRESWLALIYDVLWFYDFMSHFESLSQASLEALLGSHDLGVLAMTLRPSKAQMAEADIEPLVSLMKFKGF